MKIGPLLESCVIRWTVLASVSGLFLSHSTAQTQSPQEALRNYKSAIRFLEGGDIHGAETEIAKALEILPSQPEILNLAGTIALRQRRIDQAIEYLEASLRQRPDYAHPRLNLGLA